jgi:hypothetical protein
MVRCGDIVSVFVVAATLLCALWYTTADKENPASSRFLTISRGNNIRTRQNERIESHVQPESDRLLQVTTSYTYTASYDNFLNPERGLYTSVDLMAESSLGWIYDKGFTLIQATIQLDKYRTVSLPTGFLTTIVQKMALIRAAGLKVILRFAYNNPSGADYVNAQDASLSQIKAHLLQLATILKSEMDVIAVLQAGFIGAWGEWHSSSNNLTTATNRAAVKTELLKNLPTGRMVQFRDPADLMTWYPSALLTTNAFSTVDQARAGHHNDCFLSSITDGGTYSSDATTRENQKIYLAKMTTYTMMGGETCLMDTATLRNDCTTAVGEMKRFHYVYLNRDYYAPNFDRWIKDNCYNNIVQSLGYRYQLTKASIVSAKPGGIMTTKVALANVGWAALINPRPLELVLRNKSSGKEMKLRYSSMNDVRKYLPLPTRTVELTIPWTLPTTGLTPGTHILFLNLPDADSRLVGKPKYSIRLATTGIWESSTGYNRIGEVTVLS